MDPKPSKASFTSRSSTPRPEPHARVTEGVRGEIAAALARMLATRQPNLVWTRAHLVDEDC